MNVVEYPVEVGELTVAMLIGKTKLYSLIKQGHIRAPEGWCSKKKVAFCLKQAAIDIAKYNNLQAPSDRAIEFMWSKIYDSRV
jgi:hypothetical protein